jgi:hypothetical protein
MKKILLSLSLIALLLPSIQSKAALLTDVATNDVRIYINNDLYVFLADPDNNIQFSTIPNFTDLWNYINYQAANATGKLVIAPFPPAWVQIPTEVGGIPSVFYAENLDNDGPTSDDEYSKLVQVLSQVVGAVDANPSNFDGSFTNGGIFAFPDDSNPGTNFYYHRFGTVDAGAAQIPIDGGLSFLALGGIAFGISRIRRKES